MSVLCYCKKCGRIVQKNQNKEWYCDYCNSKVFAIPDEYLDEKCKIAFKDKDLKEQFINEHIKSSTEFNQYLFDHRDEDLAAHSKQLENVLSKAKAEKNSTPKCPSCGSTNISKIGAINRAVSVGIFGLASGKIGKTHKCNKCGTMW